MSFLTQGPLPPGSKVFVGRSEELKKVESWLRNLNCFAAIMGARQTGKTSFLLKFRETCRDRYSMVYINLQCIEGADLEQCYRHIADELLQELDLDRNGLSLPRDGPSFLKFLRDVARSTSVNRIAVLLDEYGALPSETAIKLAHTIRSVFNDRFVKAEYERFFFTLAGATDMLQLTSGRNSPLANVTDSVYLVDLSEQETTLLLEAGSGFPQAELSHLVFEWSNGHPYWTQLLASRCLSESNRSVQTLLGNVVEDLLQREDRNLPHLIKGLVNGSERLRDTCRAIVRREEKRFSRTDPIIAELELLGAIRNQDGQCVVRNRVYEETLQRHFVGDFSTRSPVIPASGRQPIQLGSLPRLVRMLHLSDLHLGTLEDARSYRAQLLTDLTEELSVSSIDYLILSGDIADHALPDEYSAALELINPLLTKMSISRERVIVAPGNHDVNWDLSSQAYKPIPRFKLKEPLGEEFIPAGPAGALRREEDLYRKRFAHFGDFCAKLGGVYPEAYAEQSILTTNEQYRILFLSLNSCWQLDHYWTERASIQSESLGRALERMDGYRDWLKIAVWHHPVSGVDCMNSEYMELLSVHGFALGMHGHIHEAVEQFHKYDALRSMHIVGAGTFGAPARQQVTGIPLQYNLLSLDACARTLTVQSRKKEKRFGAWSADARWGDKKDPRPSYLVDLSRKWNPVGFNDREFKHLR
jgi:AAA-like domain/Calcineurin-like phosphoesterase